MPKNRIPLACSACGQPASQWAGRCPACGGWGTIAEQRAAAGPEAAPVSLGGEPSAEHTRLPTGFEGVDRVLGGGLVPGSVVLIAGEPGIGKSTLLLQVAAELAGSRRPCLVASGEETREQVGARARRLGLIAEAVSFVPGRELPAVIDAARALRPAVVIVDSVQSIRDPEHPSLPGGVAQVRACTDALVGLAKAEGIAVILAGQVTKDGDLAGPRTLEHAVDVVCSFEGDAATGLRVLLSTKNRFGAEGELAWFEMGGDGLIEVDPGRSLAPGRGEPGAATAILGAGRRALALEVQALVVPGTGPPRRQVSGLDPRRFRLVSAVVDRGMGLGLSRAEVYGATAGGLRVEDPGADLAMAAAVVSAARAIPPPVGSAFVGEVSLTGSIRPVPGLGLRLAAAAAAGITTVFAPEDVEAPAEVRVVPVRRVSEALGWAGSRDRENRSVRPGNPVPSTDRPPDQEFSFARGKRD